MTDTYELLKHTLHIGDPEDPASRRSFLLKCLKTGNKYFCERKKTAHPYSPGHLLNDKRVDPNAPIEDEFGCRLPIEHYGYTDFQFRDSSVTLRNGDIHEGWTGMAQGNYRDIKQEIADFLDTFEFGPDTVPISEIPRTTDPEETQRPRF